MKLVLRFAHQLLAANRPLIRDAGSLRHLAIELSVLYSVDEWNEAVYTMRDCGFSSTGFGLQILSKNQVEKPVSSELVFVLDGTR